MGPLECNAFEPIISSTTVEELELRLTNPREIAHERICALGFAKDCDGRGLATTMVQMLQDAAEHWISSVKRCCYQPAKFLVSCDEKKDDDEDSTSSSQCSSELCMERITNTPETYHLHRVLSLHLFVAKSDPTLAEEMGREGSHLVLSRLARLDVYSMVDTLTEDDEDAVVALQDLACEIGSLSCAFPMKYSPYSAEELLRRLPLNFTVKPVVTSLAGAQMKKHDEVSILINQVTVRQSAQEDVGFVMWPSAVILSSWVVSKPHLVHGKRVLEIGAGCGLVGLVTAGIMKANDSNSACIPRAEECHSKVLLTDFNDVVLQNIEQNIQLNNIANFVQKEKLDFYSQSGSQYGGGWLDGFGKRRQPVDLVLAADVICKPEDAVAAANTIFDCLTPGGEAFVVSADAMHRFGVEKFESECLRLGMKVLVSDVQELLDGQLLSSNTQSLELTSGFVEGMMLTMFHVTKPLKKEVRQS